MQIQMQMQAALRAQGAGGGPGTLVGELDFNGSGGSERGGGKAKRRFLWTEMLHRRFVAAMFDYGVQNATPKTLFQLMQARYPRARLLTRSAAAGVVRLFEDERRHLRANAALLATHGSASPDPPPLPTSFRPTSPPPSALPRAAGARRDDVGPHQEPPAEVPRQHQGGPRHVPEGLRAHAPRGREPLP
jgi:SHAQKYF class myb-like DNA-binding protein